MADNTTLNPGAGGDVIASDDIGGVKHQLVKLEYGPADVANQVSLTQPLPVIEGATFGYDAGNAIGTIDVPASALLKRVSVIAGSVDATITIGGGDIITVPAGGSFDEQIPGRAVGADVVLGGSVTSYYVSWVTPS